MVPYRDSRSFDSLSLNKINSYLCGANSYLCWANSYLCRTNSYLCWANFYLWGANSFFCGANSCLCVSQLLAGSCPFAFPPVVPPVNYPLTIFPRLLPAWFRLSLHRNSPLSPHASPRAQLWLHRNSHLASTLHRVLRGWLHRPTLSFYLCSRMCSHREL